MKIASDNSDIYVVTTRGFEGQPPDIWLRWDWRGQDSIVKITIDEARELANLLLLKANNARESD